MNRNLVLSLVLIVASCLLTVINIAIVTGAIGPQYKCAQVQP